MPWLASTGPTTSEGKAAVSQNAFKHGAFSAETAQLNEVLADVVFATPENHREDIDNG